jgi:hypothetical protein
VFFWVFRPLLADIQVGGIAPFANLSDPTRGGRDRLFIVPVDRAKGLF